MATVNELLAKAKQERTSALHAQKRIYENAELAGRKTLTAAENAELAKLREAADKAKATIEQLRSIAAEESDAYDLASTPDPNGKVAQLPNRTASLQVGRNERTYRKDLDPNGSGFIYDVVQAQVLGNPDSWARLTRHMEEERVERGEYQTRAAGDLTTTGVASLIVPQYLIQMAAPAVSARRPFADEACTHMPLPSQGLKIEISRITTASSVALQAAELDAVSATSMDDTNLEIAVQTAAGQQVVSLQAVLRGNAVEPLVVSDLLARYATTLDSTLLNQATTGLSAVAQDTNYSDTTPTVAELYPKILASANNVETALLGGRATHVVMHPRRWNWMSKEMVSTWPFINSPAIPVQAGATSTDVGYNEGIRGRLPNGLLVVTDANVATNFGTNEDEIYVVPKQECLLWEDANAPVMIRAEQPKAPNLAVLLVVFGFFAYTFGRYTNGMAKISDTGLIAPTF